MASAIQSLRSLDGTPQFITQGDAETIYDRGMEVRGKIGSGTSAALRGLSDAESTISYLKGMQGGLSQNIEASKQKAEALNQDINDARAQADKVNTTAGLLNPYINKYNEFADSIFKDGQTLVDKGKGILGDADNLLGLNDNAGGLIGEYAKNIKSFDPNKYVSMAASDVQNSFTNAEGQLTRALARQGLTGTDARSVTMRQQYAQSLAAALAGAKTRARQAGLNEQTAALRNALSDAMGVNKQGGDLVAQGAGIKKDAGAMLGGAVDTIKSIGDLQTKAAEIVLGAGSLRAKQASLFIDISQTLVSNGSAIASATNAAVNASGNAADAFLAGAKILKELPYYDNSEWVSNPFFKSKGWGFEAI